MNNRKRFRKVSLRLALFVLMPLCAIGLFIGSRVMHANEQLAILQSLRDQSIVTPAAMVPEEAWWDAFWGGNPLMSIEYAAILGTPDDFDVIAPLMNLKMLSLDQPPGDLTALQVRACIEKHPRLESFSVHGEIHADVWREISRIPRLRGVSVGEAANISDEALSFFAACPLHDLTVTKCASLSDEACNSIAKMRGLRNLILLDGAITDRGIELLGELKSLEQLSLSKTLVTGKGLRVLENMPRLELLSLAQCPLDANAFEHIAKLRHLQWLYLDGTSINDDQLARLGHMTELKTLSLPGTNMTDEATKQIAKFPALQRLDLSYTRVTDQGLRRLAGLTDLRSLTCYGTYVSPGEMNRLGDAVTRDQSDSGLKLYWQGAACIDTSNGQVVGYVPGVPRALSNTHAAARANELNAMIVFGILPSEPMTLIRNVETLSMEFIGTDLLAMTGLGDRLSVYELPSGSLLRDLKVPPFGSTWPVIRVVGEQIVTTNYNGIASWDLKSGQQLWGGPPNKRFRTDTKIVVRGDRMALFDLQEIHVVTTAGEAVEFLRHRIGGQNTSLEFPLVRSVGFDDNAHVIYAQISDEQDVLEIRDLEANKTITTIDVNAQKVKLSANAKLLLTFTAEDQTFTIWNAVTGEQIANITGDFDDRRMMFTPDGRYLIFEVRNDAIKADYR